MSNDVLIAIGLTIGLTVLIGVIEVLFLSKLWNPWLSCCTVAFVLYLLVLIVGNFASTLVAHSIVVAYISEPVSAGVAASEAASSDRPPTASVSRSLFASVPWFWSAFLGVFAFEAILQRINVTFFDKGVLTISDWIAKSRDGAVAAAIKSHAHALVRREQILATKISASTSLTDLNLNAYVHDFLGPNRVQELEQAAIINHANPRLMKALALAAGAYERASHIV